MSRLAVATFALVTIAGCSKKSSDDGDVDETNALLGGDLATVFIQSSGAFQIPIPTLSELDAAKHLVGDSVFDANFVTAPSRVFPGLGPLYNNTGCSTCHVKEGRGEPQLGVGPQGSQMLVMTSMLTGEPDVPGGQIPVPGLGFQVRDQAIFGQIPNAAVSLEWEDLEEETFADGTPFRLRRPKVNVTLTGGGSLPEGAVMSARQPLPVFGMGLLEAIPEEAIRARSEDPNKVKGRVNEVWSRIENKLVIGRFGRKAGLPSIVEQAAKAFSLDVGITNDIFVSGEEAPGAAVEISRADIESAAFYLRTIAVPARRNLGDPTAQRGEAIFREAGCTGCHVEEWQTGDHEIEALANQTIHPYSDLLLHDMGEGLADGRPEFGASGSEWRTPTLWGIGLTETVLPRASYLHDGRARSPMEAILWHGGQARGPREYFRNLPAADREALLKFLKSI